MENFHRAATEYRIPSNIATGNMYSDNAHNSTAGRHAEVVNVSSISTPGSQNSARSPNIRSILYHNVPNSTAAAADSSVDDLLSLVLDGDEDRVQSVLAEDSLIRKYASLHMQSLGSQYSGNSEHIFILCQELRVLARLVIWCRRRMPSADLWSLIRPECFRLVIAASRKQPTAVVDVLGRAVGMKLVDAVQRDDDGAARHAWNFRDLFLLWRDSLVEDNDSVLESYDDSLPQSGPGHNLANHSVSETIQQPVEAVYNVSIQPESVHHDSTCLPEANELSDAFTSNPLQHVYSSHGDSFVTLTVDRDGCFDYMNPVVPDNLSETTLEVVNGNLTGARDAFDTTDTVHVSGAVSGSEQFAAVMSEYTLRMDSETTVSQISSSCQEIAISESSRENPYCYYCGQPQARIQHHWYSMHSEEKEVVELVSMAPGMTRVREMTELRNRGNHCHNLKVLKDGRGTLVVLFNPMPGAKPQDYSPCCFCLNYMNRAELLRHQCQFLRHDSERGNKRNKRTVCSGLASISTVSSDGISVRKSSLDKPHKIQVVSYMSLHGKKGYRCYFCGKWYQRLRRHWYAKHRNEPEVKELVAFGPSDRSARLGYTTRLRNLGNHEHNVKVLKAGRGQLFVAHVRRVGRHDIRYSDYVPCEFCWSYLLNATHRNAQCKCAPESDLRPHRTRTSDCRFLLPTSKNFRDQVGVLLVGMRDDNVKLVAESDPLIVEYVAKLLSIGTAESSVRKRTRLLARFLMEIRNLTGLSGTTLGDCILSENFNRCVFAAEAVGASSDPVEMSPTTDCIRNVLRQVSKLVKRDAVDRRDAHAVRDADRFAHLCMSEWISPPEEAVNSDVESE